MHVLNESHILLFLIQVLLVLGLARGLGLLFRRFGQPAITAEILVGVILGPTILGRLLPDVQRQLFPEDAAQQAMLQTVAWLGIMFFLLVTGLETDFANAWRQRGQAVRISLSDLIVPMAIAFGPCLLLPDSYLPAAHGRLTFSFFVATIMTISALPVAARAMQDLGIYRTDLGLLIVCALTINDVAGWLIFALILGLATGVGMTVWGVLGMVGWTVLFTGSCLTAGRAMTHRLIGGMQRLRLPEPGTSLTFICLLGLLCGAITVRIGIHALFGFFLAGIMAGDSKALSESTREVIRQMVRAVLVPLFFGTIGLHLDFLSRFDLPLVAFMTAVGIAGRFAGAYLGMVWARQPSAHRLIAAIAHVPGGAMQIVVGMLALECGVITQTVFVAVVFGALASSMILGPWMNWALDRSRRRDAGVYLLGGPVVVDLRAATPEEAIRALCEAARRRVARADPDSLAAAVLAREAACSTALGDGLAVPHARLAALAEPLVVLGRSAVGVDWNAPDGRPAHLLFLVLTPSDDDEAQVRILRAIALAMASPAARTALQAAPDEAVFRQALAHALRPEGAAPAPHPQPGSSRNPSGKPGDRGTQ